MLNYALESLDNLRPGDCIVCFNKNDIYSVSRQIEARGLECAVIYGSLPPGKTLCLFFLKECSASCCFLGKTFKMKQCKFCYFCVSIVSESNQLLLTGVLISGLDLYYVLKIDLQIGIIKLGLS